MLRKNGTAPQCKPGEPFLSFRRSNWPTYRFYDVPDGPLGISFFIAAVLTIAPPPRRSRESSASL